MSSHPQIDPAGVEEPASALWKNELLDRLAAHRSRRGGRSPISNSQEALLASEAEDPNRNARIAAAIAERFSHQPTYRELQAAEEAARQRLAEEAQNDETLSAAQEPLFDDANPIPEPQPDDRANTLDPRRLYIESSHRVVLHAPMPAPLPHQQRSRAATAQDETTASVPGAPSRAELEDLIHSVLVEPSVPLPAKLLEFPRELIAPRKARPRIVEGPLLQESATLSADDAAEQLRIFEVESATISHQVSLPVTPDAGAAEVPVWSSIRLDDHRGRRWESEAPQAVSPFSLPPQPAGLSRRALACAIDVAYVAGAFSIFAAAFFLYTDAPLTLTTTEFGAGIFAIFFMMYQWLFFTYAEATPGMRSARIALCTFDDNNPTRRAMRRRLGALVLAACPLGLGFLWAIVDEDSLGWHDRIARMYQRSY